MPYRIAICLLLGLLAGACATPNYTSPAPDRAEVASIHAETEFLTPDRQPLTVTEAAAIVTPIFTAITMDAAMICRTISEADTCAAPGFQVVDEDHVNARSGFTVQNDPEITLTRGLVEYFADRPDELALVIGHEYGHLITDHVEERRANDGVRNGLMGTALSVLMTTAAVVGASEGYYSGGVYSPQQISEYMASTDDPEGLYRWFSRGQELEADYIATYLATRSGYAPTGRVLMEMGALERLDELTSAEKQDRRLPFSFWDTHPYSPDRAARVRETLEEIEMLKGRGYARPIPPRLILNVQDNNAAFHTLEELVAPLPE